MQRFYKVKYNFPWSKSLFLTKRDENVSASFETWRNVGSF